jgi:multidrug efflux pump subunit AcrA (membrane-fusion protein)
VNGVSDGAQRPRTLWTYDGRRFTPVLVRFGLSDGQWTEMLTGALHAGDRVVTNAVLKKAARFP